MYIKLPPGLGARLIGRLEIPRLDVSSVILEGVGSKTLRVGLGHVPGTPLPGTGNVVIAGHRDAFFRPLRKIEICDEVSVETTARTYYYQVRSFEVVDPRDVNALRFHNKNELTLITCYPFSSIGPAPKRFVVHAEPVLRQSSAHIRELIGVVRPIAPTNHLALRLARTIASAKFTKQDAASPIDKC